MGKELKKSFNLKYNKKVCNDCVNAYDDIQMCKFCKNGDRFTPAQ